MLMPGELVGVGRERDVRVGVSELTRDEHDVEPARDECRGISVPEAVQRDPVGAAKVDAVADEFRCELPDARLVAEVGLAPGRIHQAARRSPGAWAHGAGAVLIGAGGDPFLRMRIAEGKDLEWSRAFPGLTMPEGVPQ